MVAIVLFLLILFWKKTWSIVGIFIPKFVWIGLLGWFFIAANIIPTLMTSGSWGIEALQGKDKAHSIALPGARYFSINEKDIPSYSEEMTKEALDNYLEHFIVPANIQAPIPHLPGKPDYSIIYTKSPGYKMARYGLILLAFILFFDIFLSVSIYNHGHTQTARFFLIFSEHSRERESNVKRKLFLLSFLLLILAVLSLNYFILFWILSFLTTIFIFKWEILQRGQNHKPLSRAVLFVFLTQIFSAISGMILFFTIMPVYTFIHYKAITFNIYDSIVIGWAIILGSSITVLLGIITQVIWSGRRMTEGMKE